MYYLTYCAPGTEWSTYGMGAYKSDSPLGPWEYMPTSPFLSQNTGIVRGPGHGCIVDGPNGTVWAFYTCCLCFAHHFERRIGYDPIGFDEEGNIIPAAASQIPQLAPGLKPEPHLGNDAGLIPLTQRRYRHASSHAPGREPIYALDDSMLTWWQPAQEDPEPTLTVFLPDMGLELRSARLIWRDVGLDVNKGYLPGPFRYCIEAMDMQGQWQCVLDRRDNREDMTIEYSPLVPMRAKQVRIRITGAPAHITPGLISFTVFGPRP